MKIVYGVGLALWLVSLPLISSARVSVWGDEVALWQSADFWAPDKIRPDAEMGRLLHLRGRLEEAEAAYLRAIRQWEAGRPSHERVGCRIAAHNLSVLYQQQARWAEATAWGAYSCVLR